MRDNLKHIIRNIIIASLPITIAFVFVFPLSLPAQGGTWTWMAGNNALNSPGVFGTQGVASPLNTPPALYEACEWTDNNGNFWLFGGLNFIVGLDMFSALWKFDPVTNQWTWMQGPNTGNQPPVYGTQGVPGPANTPGARSYGVECWVDNNNNLWLFGGYGYDVTGFPGYLNDLWKYDPATNEWTYMHGFGGVDISGDYGVLGVPAATNIPGSRAECNATGTTSDGCLWLFGGSGYDDTGILGDLEDVWKYDPAVNMWTWMAGTNIAGAVSNYGVQGVPAPSNTPGGRWCYTGSTDANDNFWIFGGSLSFGGSGNDVWRFNTTTLIWTWMGGTNTFNSPGNYTAYCQPSVACFPPAVMENRAHWQDGCGRLWYFGGSQVTGSGNDLWMYDMGTSEFTWVSGSAVGGQLGVYGTQGVPDPANVPGNRMGSSAFTASNGDLWLFGGIESGGSTYNDLWRFQVDTLCVPGGAGLVAAFNPQQNGGCAPLTVNFNNATVGGTSYSWDFGDGTNSNAVNPSHLFNNPGTYTIKLVASGSCGIDSVTSTIQVSPAFTVDIGPDSSICPGASVLLDAGNPGATYAWSTGANTQQINAGANNWVWVDVTIGACTVRDSMLISFLPAIVVGLGNDVLLCDGDSVILDAGNPGMNYLWNTGLNTQTITAGGNNIYWVEVTNGVNCPGRDTVEITSFPFPVVNLGNDTTICSGQTVTLDLSNPGCNYLWSTGANTQTLTVGTSTICWGTATNAGGCSDSDTISITVQPAIIINLGPDQNLCQPATAILDAGNPGMNYVWNTGDITQTITVSTTGTYSVTVTDAFGCSNTDQINITSWPLPIVNLGPDADICEGQSQILDASNSGLNYNWSSGQNTQTITVTTSGTFIVTVTNGGGCTGSDAITISFQPLPIVNLGPDQLICNDDTVFFDAGNPGSTYHWSTGNSTQLVSVTQGGTYFVTVTTIFGCVNTDDVSISIRPDFTLNLGPDTTLCRAEQFKMQAGVPGKSYLWSNGATSEILFAEESGEYWVTVWDECYTHSDSINVTFTGIMKGPFVPTAFTPNGDGINDEFKIYGLDNAESFHLLIFDRWGNLIFETKDINEAWKGKLNTDDAAEGVYAFKYKAMDCKGVSRYISGTVTLLR